MGHVQSSTPQSRIGDVIRIAGGVAAAVVAAVAVNTVIAALAIAAGAAGPFQPLHPVSYVRLTTFGVVAGAVGWAGIRHWTDDPRAILRRLVPIVVALTFIPDAILLVSDVQPNTSGIGVAALVAMHIATAAIGVATYARIMPLGRERPSGRPADVDADARRRPVAPRSTRSVSGTRPPEARPVDGTSPELRS